MGRRSQARNQWAKRHDAPTSHTNRVWVCASCRNRTTLITCADGKQRCLFCKQAFERISTEATV